MKTNNGNDFKTIVAEDLACFLKEQTHTIYFNERDLQVKMAHYLQETKHYDGIELEYYVPNKILTQHLSQQVECPWSNEFKIDIVVRLESKFIPIELKYKTKKEKDISFARFGENIGNDYLIIKDQSAQDLGRYDFWKDVRRIELIKQRFSNVEHGFCVFLTNDISYQKTPDENVKYINFSMEDGANNTTEMKWNGDFASEAKHPNFILNKMYSLHWEKVTKKPNDKDVDFYYVILEV